jgi:predicted PurR-regulated permease PerM
MNPNSSFDQRKLTRLVIEIALSLGLLLLVLYWCYGIVKPFIDFILWAVIFAVALYPGYKWLRAKLGGRKIVASVLLVSALIIILLVPVILFANSLYEGITFMKSQYESNGNLLPSASEKIAELPVIGPIIYEKWNSFTTHTGEALQEYAPQLKDVSFSIISSVASAGVAFIKLFVSIILAGVVLIYSEEAGKLANGFFNRILGDSGEEYSILAEKTIRTVVKGVLGVAFIQSLLLGIGLAVVGVPAAGLLFMISLILGIIQIGIFLVVIPVVIYVFATYSTTTAVLFLVWCIIISPLDNILKPILLGKGALVPMPIIFIGAIGGFIFSGFVGLFTGAIVFSVGYKLFILWMDLNKNEIKTT